MMKYVTAWIGSKQPEPRHALGIEAARTRYGEALTIITEWPQDCDAPHTGNEVYNSETLRVWLLAVKYADIPVTWLDADALLLSLPEDIGRPFSAQVNGAIDDFILGHFGNDQGSIFFPWLSKMREPNAGWFMSWLRRSNFDINLLPSTSFTHKQGAV